MRDHDTGDPRMEYIKAPPPPRTAPLSAREVDAATNMLVRAAIFATAPGTEGQRWVPGLSIAVVHLDHGVPRVVCCDGFGVKRVDAPGAPGRDTLFPCASLSKPVAATILALRNGQKPPPWELPVCREDGSLYRLANAPGGAVPTLEEWLSHTTGLPDHAGDLIEDMSPGMSRDRILDNILRYQTGIDPGPYRYTNFGFTAGCLGISGSDWERFAQIGLDELGMKRSTYVFTSAFDPGAGDRVVPHRGMPYLAFEPEPTGWSWNVVGARDERNPSRQAPAGSLLSTARDMATFLTVHLEAWVNRRFGDFPRKSAGYSLGWNVANHLERDGFDPSAINAISFSHSGAFTMGAATCLRVDPGAGVAVAILTNGEPCGVPELLVRIFFNHLYGRAVPPAFQRAGGELDLAAVLGFGRALMLSGMRQKENENARRYPPDATQPIPGDLPQGEVFRGHSDYYGCDVVIERRGDEMVLSMGEIQKGEPYWRFPLRCHDASSLTFVYETRGENAIGVSAIRLHRGADGRIERLHDHWLNQEPAGSDTGSGVGVINAQGERPT
jgi:CubicO group peptidase (beta-lactamase class C family)